MKTLNNILLCLILSTLIAHVDAETISLSKSTKSSLAEPTIVHLNAQVQSELKNDETTVSMFSEERGKNVAKLANKVNRDISLAIKKAKSVAGIEIMSGSTSTSPTYNKDKQDGWVVHSDLNLSSKNTSALAQLTGELQSILKLNNVSFSISSVQRQQALNELISKAINSLKVRAKIIADAIGKNNINISDLDINDRYNDNQYTPGLMLRRAAPNISSPSWEKGKQIISVEVSGKVELR